MIEIDERAPASVSHSSCSVVRVSSFLFFVYPFKYRCRLALFMFVPCRTRCVVYGPLVRYINQRLAFAFAPATNSRLRCFLEIFCRDTSPYLW